MTVYEPQSGCDQLQAGRRGLITLSW